MSHSGYKRGRVAALDIARGIAILGTLATNIWIFSHPAGMIGYLQQPRSVGVPAWQSFTEGLLQQLANGKFLGVLTLMFGVGLAIQRDSALRRGRRWPGPYLWRAALLLLDAVLHYLLVVEFDILMGYAITAMIVSALVITSRRVQTAVIIICSALHAMLITALTALLFILSDPGPYSGPNPYADASWLELVGLRVQNMVAFRAEIVLIGFLSVAMFLAGVRLWEAGVFRTDGVRLRRRLMIIGAVAFTVDLITGLADRNLVLVGRYLLAPIIAAGLLALIAEVTLRRSPGFIGRRMGEVGRTALSCYMLQNIVASALFYGWGLGLNQVPPQWRLPVTVTGWLAVSAAVVVAAHAWLRRYERGPVEWAWARSYQLLVRETARSGSRVVGAESLGEREQVAAGRHLPR